MIILPGLSLKARARLIQQSAIKTALCFVNGAINARELVFGDHIARHALFDLRQALVVGLAKGLEGAVKIAEGGVGVGGLGFDGLHGTLMVELSPPEDWSAPDGATQTRRVRSEYDH
jgi:hypothetical protein